jgi:hypothetical protein
MAQKASLVKKASPIEGLPTLLKIAPSSLEAEQRAAPA